MSDSVGHEARALRRRVRLLGAWLTDAQRKTLIDLQIALDATTGQSGSIAALRGELLTEVSWRAAEIDGCQRALELVPVGTRSGGGVGSTEARIYRKMHRRAAEIAELETEIARLAEVERSRRLEHDIAERRLLEGLRLTCVEAEAAKGAERAMRRRRSLARSEVLDLNDAMWSPVPVLGYRIWGVHQGQLHGARTLWPTNRFIATCDENGDVPHTDGSCATVAFGCGVYAAKSVTELMAAYSVTEKTLAVIGMVALEGRVVEHSKGYRAEEATVVSAVVLGLATGAACRIQLVADETEVEELFVDWAESVRNSPGEELFPISTKEMIEMIHQFMEQEASRRSGWI